MNPLLHLGEAVTAYDAELMRERDFPLLYECGVVYQLDPEDEPWLTCDQVLSRGAGDCEDLGGWRAAELRVRGWKALRPGDVGFDAAQALRPATIRAFADVLDFGPGQYHVVTHFQIGRVMFQDDPSARLGMKLGRIDPLVLSRWSSTGTHPRVAPRWA